VRPLYRVTQAAASVLLIVAASAAAHAGGPLPGEPAPDFALPGLRFYHLAQDQPEITRRNAGLLYEPVRLHTLRGRPVLLVFASRGSPLGAGALDALEGLHREYGDRVQLLLVYTRSAPGAPAGQRAPATLLERIQLANHFVSERGLTIPCVVDGMDDATLRAYAAGSGRLYLLGSDGRVEFVEHGDAGFDPETLEAEIGRLLAR